MYILMERNSRGNLEVEHRIVKKTIEFVVINNVKGVDRFVVETNFDSDEQLFIIVKMYVTNREQVEIDELKLNSALVYAIENTIGIKPKNTSFAYIKN